MRGGHNRWYVKTFSQPQVTYGDGLAVDEAEAPFLMPRFSAFRFDDFGQLSYVVHELATMIDAGTLSVTDLMRQRSGVRDYVGMVLKGLRFNTQDHRQEPIADIIDAELMGKIHGHPVTIRACVNGPFQQLERDGPLSPRRARWVVRVHEGTGAKSYLFDTEAEANAFKAQARPSVSFVRAKKPVPTQIARSRVDGAELGVSPDGKSWGQTVKPLVAEKVDYGAGEVTVPLPVAWIALSQHGKYGIKHVSTRMRDKHWTLEEVTPQRATAEPQPGRQRKGS